MTASNEVLYRLQFSCDGCGTEHSYESAWEPAATSHNAYLPHGWARFHSISILQIDDVARSGRDLDFCADCLETRTLNSLIVKLPYDTRSLKATVVHDRGNRDPGTLD